MWTARKEEEVTCEGALGAVANDEVVARLLLIQTPPQGWRPFKRSDFLPPENRPISDVCGDSDGCSIDRASSLSPEQLKARSDSFAAASQAAAEAKKPQKIQRSGGGALSASVEGLRQLTTKSLGDAQAIFIYADPLPASHPLGANDEHSIMRISTDVREEELTILLDDLAKQFK